MTRQGAAVFLRTFPTWTTSRWHGRPTPGALLKLQQRLIEEGEQRFMEAVVDDLI